MLSDDLAKPNPDMVASTATRPTQMIVVIDTAYSRPVAPAARALDGTLHDVDDDDDRYSPTIPTDSVRLFMCIGVNHSCTFGTLDVSGAYDPTLNYKGSNGKPLCLFLQGSLYGFQTAGENFWLRARAWLLHLGYKQATADPCLFCLCRDDKFSLIDLYIDDCLLAHDSGEGGLRLRPVHHA